MKKSILITTASTLLFATLSFADNACYKHPTFAKDLGEEKAKELLKRDNIKFTPEGGFGGYFQADINNDGKIEDVIVYYNGGSLGVLDIITLEHNNKHSKNLGPPEPDLGYNGPFYENLYVNKTTGTNEFLTQLCGKTYIVVSTTGSRDPYIWKNGKVTVPTCDEDWFNYQKNIFQTLYQKQEYQAAAINYPIALNECPNFSKPQEILWLENDLALVNQKINEPKQCLDIIEKIEKDPHYPDATETLKKAVAFNKNKCTVDFADIAKMQKPKGDKEYAWLLNDKLPEAEKDTLLTKLLQQASPTESPAELFGKETFGAFRSSFANELRGRVYPPEITEQRYGISSGFIAHEAIVRGILWVDIKEGTSVVGFVVNPDNVIITSKFYNEKNIPNRAKQDIKNEIKDIMSNWGTNLAEVRILFYDGESKKVDTLSFTWFD